MRFMVFTKNWIGDAIFSEPLIRYLKTNYPGSFILCVTTPRCAPVFRSNPFVDEILFFDEKNGQRSWFKRFLFVSQLRRHKIDEAFLLHKSFSRSFLVMLAGISKRRGFSIKGKGKLLTDAIVPEEQRHDAEDFLALAGKENFNDDEKKYRFYHSEEDTRFVQSLLRQQGIYGKRFVVLNPGANWLPKRWPPSHFAMLAKKLHEKFKLTCLISGSNQDESVAKEIIALSGSSPNLISVCGKTNLNQLAALFRQAFCVVTADSGPLHIASGVGANVVALFGPTNPVKTGPAGVGCNQLLSYRKKECSMPCFQESCMCMNEISVDQVAETVAKLMELKNDPASI